MIDPKIDAWKDLPRNFRQKHGVFTVHVGDPTTRFFSHTLDFSTALMTRSCRNMKAVEGEDNMATRREFPCRNLK